MARHSTYHGLTLRINVGTRRWLNPDPIAEAGGINLYAFVGNGPVNAVDPVGLWNLWNPATWGDVNPIGWSTLNSLTPWHDSSGYTWEGLKWNTGQAAQATLDGIIPFWDPFVEGGGYRRCDETLALSRELGAFSRDTYLFARIPNLAEWLKHPRLYSLGSRTFPNRLFDNVLKPLTATDRGRWALQHDYRFASWGERLAAYSGSANTGLTPTARTATLILFSATDSYYRYDGANAAQTMQPVLEGFNRDYNPLVP